MFYKKNSSVQFKPLFLNVFVEILQKKKILMFPGVCFFNLTFLRHSCWKHCLAGYELILPLAVIKLS